MLKYVSVITNENYGRLITALDDSQKALFYETLAFELTIASRLWSEPNLSVEEIISQLKWLNEIQHRVVSKIRHIRSSTDARSEDQFISIIYCYFEKNRNIESAVIHAFNNSYKNVVKSY